VLCTLYPSKRLIMEAGLRRFILPDGDPPARLKSASLSTHAPTVCSENLGTSRRSVRQFDSVGVILVALVLFGKDSFEPMCLFFSDPSIRGRWMVSDDELLAATVTAHGPHFKGIRRFLSALTLLYCRCPHLLNPESPLPLGLLSALRICSS
jgi:hypothetical protein